MVYFSAAKEISHKYTSVFKQHCVYKNLFKQNEHKRLAIQS